MKQKSMIYLFLLGSMIAAFFMFTGGVTSSSPTLCFSKPFQFYLHELLLQLSMHKLPFSIQAENKSYRHKDCDDEYSTARDLIGSLVIKQGATVVGHRALSLSVESGSDKGGIQEHLLILLSSTMPVHIQRRQHFMIPMIRIKCHRQ